MERGIYKRKRHNTTYLEVLTYSLGHVLEQTVHWCCSILTEFRSLQPLFIPCSIVLDKEMLKKQKRQIRGEIWCLRKLLHCWSDHDCSSRKLFACREVMSRIASARPAARHRYAHERNSGSDIAERARHCGDGMELMVGTHGPWGVSKLFFC